MCPATGKECKSHAFCAGRIALIESDYYCRDKIGNTLISELECEVASAVAGEHCAEVIRQRLANLVLSGIGVNTQRQAENLAETISYAQHGEFFSA